MPTPAVSDGIRRRRVSILWASVALGGAAYTLCVSAASDPIADLKAAASALDSQSYTTAVSASKGLPVRLPKLADYAAWIAGSAEFNLRNYGKVREALDPVFQHKPVSPLAAKAYLLAGQAEIQNSDAAAAVELLRTHYAALPQPQGDLLLAQAFAASQDQVSAAIYFQHVYYGFPASADAATAGTQLDLLKQSMGDNYPPSMPNSRLSRAFKLLKAGETAKARKELDDLVPELGGADRDLARVRIGVAHYQARETDVARHYLQSLGTLAPEADAERLYYLLECARRLDNQEEVDQTLDRLGRLYPASEWRLKALIAAANKYLTSNQIDAYEPLYRACYETFPKSDEAATCHWRVTWGHYIRRRDDAGDMLRAHLRLFPASENASAALYFLGRLAEAAHDAGAARSYYEEVTQEYPNHFYAVLARDRLGDVSAAPASAEIDSFLRSISFGERLRVKDFHPGEEASARIERAKLLERGGLNDWAEQELRFGARTGEQPYVIALELASLNSLKPDQALHYIKAYAGGYLYVPLDSAPHQFWTLAFPLAFRTDLETYSKQNGIDPFLMAALIRQESEFNPKAVSPTGARGLAQIQPTTGKELSRRLKLSRYTSAGLFQPRINLELGTYYFKQLLAQVGGKEAPALAAYDAGLTRARSWLTWGDFREPAEFIESVPFTETRGYVQGVLRNADLYRRIYGVKQVAEAAGKQATKGRSRR